LFAHEPLLKDVRSVCEPFCGKGNLVVAMRGRGLVVHASDIEDRGCPDSTVLDFLKMTERPPGCDVLLSNCAYDCVAGNALQFVEHAFALEFRLVILLLKVGFLNGERRYKRLYSRGHLRRVYPIAERLQDMHDANFTGEKASQSQTHGWFVFDRNYCGTAVTIPVSKNDPTARMPWQPGAICEQCGKSYPPQRSTSRFCSSACRQQAYRKRLSVTLSVTPPTAADEATP
jgi:hypothetical protein